MTKTNHTREESPITFAFLTGVVDALGLRRRVPELLKRRGYPVTENLSSVLGLALAYHRVADQLEQRITRPEHRPARLDTQVLFRRPAEADGCGDRWPADLTRLSAADIVTRFDLLPLLDGYALTLPTAEE